MHTGAANGLYAGLNLFVAITLLVAAFLKLRDIQSVERLLVDTLPSRLWRVRGVDSRRLGRVAAGVEAAGGVALLVAPRPVYPVVSGALVVPLLVILAVAVRAARRKVPCGCFGGARRKAGQYEIGRAATLTLTTFALCAVASIDSDVDPTTASLTVWGLGVAAVTVLFAVAPAPRLNRTPCGGSDTHIDQSPADVERSRRSVLHEIGLAAAMVGVAATMPRTVLATAPVSGCKADGPQCRPQCQAAYDQCVGANPGQKPCCIDCYVACQGVGKTCTPGLSCSGAWPNPGSFGF